MKVAVVWNSTRNGVLNRFGQPCQEVYARRHVQMVLDALQAAGHDTACFEGGRSLIADLGGFMPPHPGVGVPGGIVFNMAYGIQGACRYTHVPAMLEMAGVPYTGSGPLGHALALDKVITKILLQGAGVPTPAFRVLGHAEDPGTLRFPLVVKPRHESTSFGLQLVHTPEALAEAVAAVVGQFGQEALVEEYVDGREITIGLLGNAQPEFLPPVEIDFSGRGLRLLTWDDKYHRRTDEPGKICPAPLDARSHARLCELALATFRCCHCKDYARVDFRLDSSGRPFVLEINSMASLGDGGSFVRAATQAGYTFASLVTRILDITHERYFGVPAPRPAAQTPSTAAGAPQAFQPLPHR
jgi:D-alanine-D-alanine ligase